MLELPAVNCAPRRMLPPPITIAIWTPVEAARWTCAEISATSCMLMPRWPGAAKLSPESFRRIRLEGLESDMGVSNWLIAGGVSTARRGHEGLGMSMATQRSGHGTHDSRFVWAGV